MRRFIWIEGFLGVAVFFAQATAVLGQAGSSTAAALPTLPVKVLMQSPADTQTDLQIICLFRSSPENTLHGSLMETNEKLHGLLDQIRKPDRFGGDLGETMLLTPPEGTLGAKRLLIIGLGDSATFTPDRMEFVGKIALREANRAGVAHPFFAPTILDGGVTKFATGEVSEQVVRGFREALATHALVEAAGAAKPRIVEDVTFLAGLKFASDTQAGIDRGLGSDPGPAREIRLPTGPGPKN
jgi:hypothetical protein